MHHNYKKRFILTNKKILLCSNILWTIAQFRLGLIRAIRHAGHEVVCVADTDNFSGLSEQKIATTGARFIPLSMNRKGTNPFQDLGYLLRLRKILRQEKPALVINYTIKPVIYGSMAARLLHIPSIAVTTGLGFVFTTDTLLTRLTQCLYKFSFRFPEKVFFLNPDDQETFLKHHLVSRSKSVLLPGEGVDTDFYQPLPQSRPGSVFTFLLIARLLREKGIIEYVEAARLIREQYPGKARFLLFGYLDSDNPGAIGNDLLQQWVGEGIIEYGGTTEDIRPIIAGADCVVLPSYREGIPRTLLEAAAMGKPVIAANSPGCRNVVDDGITGYLCEPRNSRDLYGKMLQIMNLTPEERAQMGRSGRSKVLAEFDQKKVIPIYFTEIKNIWYKA